ncbi:hypothetical protein DNL40_09740 [Xylanimonas oleitrophica]|uniref:WXG100 family type VII secretion target n=1 Tax=Xylanimonas oleitrophica TaxID=2607479 RepID=A0A2W5WXB5_9MICO|nr:hypothetical protein [Xylanimonas oleitrophica]PZR52926.1 hypothetical protein DNL40_09740 [Xylanimonas oleitrophica]
MPRLALDPGSFDAAAGAVRDAASLLHAGGPLDLPAHAAGDPALAAALEDLRHAWAGALTLLVAQLDGLAPALAAAGARFADAEGAAVRHVTGTGAGAGSPGSSGGTGGAP